MFRISQKQSSIAELITKEKKEIILLTGVIGSSKTFGAAVVAISIAEQFPNSVIGVGKKNRIEITSGTIYSFQDAAEKMGVADFEANMSLLHWKFQNGSRIQFYELDQTKDREFNKIKKLELTCNIIDEADAIVEDGFWSAHGRVGRRNDCVICRMTPKDIEENPLCAMTEDGKHICPPAFSILTCNPNDGWVRQLLYNPYKKPSEHGELSREMAVVEFFQDDSFLGQAYYDKYKNAPSQFRKRYLENNWDYGDDSKALFKYAYLDSAHVTSCESGTRYCALDVARSGQDRSVIAMWDNHVLIDVRVIKDRDESKDTIEQAKIFMEYCEKNSIGYTNATVDGIGVGAGVVDYCHSVGFECQEYIAGAKSPDDSSDNNMRSYSAHKLSDALEAREAKFLDSCPHLLTLKRELTSIEYDTSDKQFKLEPKENVKKRLGVSPDVADAVLMGYSLIASPHAEPSMRWL